MNDRTKNLMLLSLTIVVCLVLAEIGLRILIGPYFIHSMPQFLVKSDYLPFTLAPNLTFRHVAPEYDVTYRTNTLGYLGEFPKSVAKPAGVKRIILLGDSVAVGYGMGDNKSFAAILASKFRNNGIEVINAGFHDAYSPDTYYAYVTKEGLQLQPDLLIMFVTTFSDSRDFEINHWLGVDENGGPIRVQTERLYSDVNGRFIQITAYESWPVVRNSYLLTSIVRHAERMLTFVFGRPGEVVPENKAATVFKAFDVIAAKVPVVYFVIPDKRFYDGNPKFVNPHRTLLALLTENGARNVVDLAPLFDKSDYFAVDPHLNENGNALVAEQVAPLIDRLPADRQNPGH
jgi:hypothetical protein